VESSGSGHSGRLVGLRSLQGERRVGRDGIERDLGPKSIQEALRPTVVSVRDEAPDVVSNCNHTVGEALKPRIRRQIEVRV